MSFTWPDDALVAPSASPTDFTYVEITAGDVIGELSSDDLAALADL